ncbi:MAG: hypothetical protein ACLGHO_06025, partial [Gammaproteobacteria bacterium]
HALKSTAANVGARKLMAACQRAGTLAFTDFLSERDGQAERLRRNFEESIFTLFRLNNYQHGRETSS